MIIEPSQSHSDSKRPPLTSHPGSNNTSFTNPSSHVVDAESNTLHLNPGASARKPRSAWKGCMWITLFLVAFASGATVHSFVSRILYNISNPHHKMYHTAEHGKAVEDWSRVVRPLVEQDTKFNIVASVWMRTNDVDADGVIYVDGEELNERRLVEKTVFEGVNLKSKNVLGEVTFNVPTKHFKQANLSNYDLRASFVITFPDRKPSPLDYAKNFVSWKPQNFTYPTVRKRGDQPSLEERILDSFGFTIPLIEFHNTSSKRPNTVGQITTLSLTEDVEQPSITQSNDVDENVDLDLEETADDKENSSNSRRNAFWLEFTEGNPVTEYHPHIVTRSQIRIVDETHLFKRTSYIKAQKELFETDCANPFRKSTPKKANVSWHDCHRQYFTRGVFETRIQLQVPDESKGSRTEWAYAPFMDAVPRTSGPKDLVSIPLDRESENIELAPGEAESVEVTWKISYSGRTYNKAFFMGMMSASLPQTYNMTAPDNELEILQYEHDLTLGTAGHRIDPNIHPRRSRLLSILNFIILLLQIGPIIHYWYSRTSTVFISRLGTAFIAIHMLTANFEDLLKAFFDPKYENDSWISKIPLLFLADLLEPLLMLKAILRIEIDWSGKRWFPKVYRAKPTHRERASDRSESKKIILVAFIILFIFTHTFTPSETYLLAPRIPQTPPPPSPFSTRHPFSHNVLSHTLTLSYAFYLTGTLLQFILNAKSKRYAGKYKLTAFLALVGTIVRMLDLSERVVGKGLVRHAGVVVGEVVALVLVIVDFGMAVMWKGVSSTEGTEDDETE